MCLLNLLKIRLYFQVFTNTQIDWKLGFLKVTLSGLLPNSS